MSCLFDSFSRFFKSHCSNSIRNIICDYLSQNPYLIDNIKAEQIIFYESKLSLEQYIRKMRLSSTWGGSIEIKSFCNIFKTNVHVINIRDNNEIIEFLSNTPSDKYIRITWSGGHFDT